MQTHNSNNNITNIHVFPILNNVDSNQGNNNNLLNISGYNNQFSHSNTNSK